MRLANFLYIHTDPGMHTGNMLKHVKRIAEDTTPVYVVFVMGGGLHMGDLLMEKIKNM